LVPQRQFLISLFIIAGFYAAAQEPQPLHIESFAYPNLDEKYNFEEFLISQRINETTDILLKGFHEKSPGFNIFSGQLVLRKKVAQKLSTLIGIRQEWDFTSRQNNQNIINPNGDAARKEIYLGLEYEPKPNLLIYAGYGQLINNPKFVPRGFKNGDGTSTFSLGSKWKF